MVLRKKQYAASCIGWATLIRVSEKIEFVNLTEGFKYKFNISGIVGETENKLKHPGFQLCTYHRKYLVMTCASTQTEKN